MVTRSYTDKYYSTNLSCTQVIKLLLFVIVEIYKGGSDIDWAEAVECVRKGMLPELEFTEDRPYNHNDFSNHYNSSYNALKYALNLVTLEATHETYRLKDKKDILQHFTVSVLLLCGENVQSKEWNQPRHIEIR